MRILLKNLPPGTKVLVKKCLLHPQETSIFAGKIGTTDGDSLTYNEEINFFARICPPGVHFWHIEVEGEVLDDPDGNY